MCTDKNNNKNKMNFLPPPSIPVALKFLGSLFVFINCFVEKKCNFMSRLSCIPNLLEMGSKKYFL